MRLLQFFPALVAGLICIWPVRALNAEGWIGISAFGIQSPRFQGKICERFLSAISSSSRPAIAILSGTFGKNNTCLKRFIDLMESQAKPYLIEFHLSNEAGRRNNFLDRGDLLPGIGMDSYNRLLEEMPAWLDALIRQQVREILLLTRWSSAAATFMLSTGLEDNYTVEAWHNLYEIAASEWPHSIIRSRGATIQMRKQDFTPPQGVYTEHHGYRKRFEPGSLCVVNGDGQDVSFLAGSGIKFREARPASRAQVEDWIEDSMTAGCLTFLWAGKWQGYFKNKPVPRPLSRRFRFDESDIGVISELFYQGDSSH